MRKTYAVVVLLLLAKTMLATHQLPPTFIENVIVYK